MLTRSPASCFSQCPLSLAAGGQEAPPRFPSASIQKSSSILMPSKRPSRLEPNPLSSIPFKYGPAGAGEKRSNFFCIRGFCLYNVKFSPGLQGPVKPPLKLYLCSQSRQHPTNK